MKVIHLISGGDSGGAKTHVFTLLKTLQQQVNIQLVCLADGVFYRQALELGIDAKLLEQKNRLDLSVLKVLAGKINDEHIDLLHCHGARANFIGGLIKKKISIPLITTVHSDYKQDFSHNFYKKVLFTKLNEFGLKKMDYYFAVTDVFKEMLVGQGFDRDSIFTIYNGIEVMPDIKAKVMVPPVFGCVTTLRPIKGTHILLEAVKDVVSKGYEPRVLIAGGGEGKYTQDLYDYVKDNKLKDNVEFKGYVKDMDGFYDEISVNILPSFTESFPYALLEGGIRRKGTIASKAGGIVEMISDGSTGRLFEVGAAGELAGIMIEFIENPELTQIYGNAFNQKIEDSFSNIAMSKRHVELYKKLKK